MEIGKRKYEDWLTKYTFENCQLNHKEYGQFLADYIAGEKQGFVLNLNGAWGTGKTEFLRRLYTELSQKQHPIIYIDVWESDFSQTPLSVVASELLSQLENFAYVIGDDLDFVKERLSKALKATIIGGAGYVSKRILDDASIGSETMKTLFESEPSDFLKLIQSGHNEQVEAIQKIRISLSRLADALSVQNDISLPVIVLVDELDRCRPNYAIEMLEVIKHFFTTANFVFVIATDTEQLSCSIKAVYGNEFDSKTYLKRFFDRTAALSDPDIGHYLQLQKIELNVDKAVTLYPSISDDKYTPSNQNATEQDVKQYLSWCIEGYGLTIRDTDQLLAKLNACLRYIYQKAKEQPQAVNIFALIIAIIEHDKNIPQFFKREKNNPEVYLSDDIDKIGLTRFFLDGDKFFTLISFIFNSSVYYMKALGKVEKNEFYSKRENFDIKGGFLGKVQINTHCHFNHLKQQGSRSKAWMWEDYRKLVLLSGHIS